MDTQKLKRTLLRPLKYTRTDLKSKILMWLLELIIVIEYEIEGVCVEWDHSVAVTIKIYR